jgi:ABC-type Fe3+/spermidine/putrescine transport system ATPase subunit
MYCIQVERVSIAYQAGVDAVKQVSLSIKQGETVSIIGESGSGKSTLLRAIACMQSCDEGEIYFEESLLPNPKDLLLRSFEGIRYVSQTAELPKSRTVEDMLKYELRYFDSNEQQVLIDQYLDIFFIQEYRHRKEYELSGGQKQRVALALALASDARLLVLDEPFNQVDIITRERVKEQLFQYFKTTGKTMIMVTHDALDALPWSDHIFVLKEGTLIQQGTPRQIYEKPVDLYVAALFGYVQMIPAHAYALLKKKKPSKFAAVRMNHIQLTEKKGEGKMLVKFKKSNYAGSRYTWLVQDEHQHEWLVYSHDKKPQQETLYLNFIEEEILNFKNA